MIDGLAMDFPLVQPLFAWLLTYLLHSTLLLGGTWLALRLLPSLRTPATEDALWTLALVGGLLTASMQGVTGLGVGIQPLAQTASGVTSPAPAQQSVAPTMSEPSSVSIESVPTASTSSDVGSRASRPPRDAGRTSDAAPAGVVSKAPTESSSTETSNATGAAFGDWFALGALLLWIAGALLMLLRRFGARIRFLRRIAPRQPVDDPDLLAIADQVSRSLAEANGDRPRPRLTVSERLASPIALAPREICLPARALGTLDRSALRCMIAHEYAHLLRRDPEWRVALTLLESIFWFQPLNRLAHRRQCDAAEQLCDAWVVACTGEPRALATSLLQVADWTTAAARPTLVSGMAGSRSSLGQRVNSLLESSSPPPRGWRPVKQLGVAVVAFGLLACTGPNVHSQSVPSPPDVPDAPSVPSVPSMPSVPSVPSVPHVPSVPSMPAIPSVPDLSSEADRYTSRRDTNSYQAKWSSNGRTVAVEVEGSVRLTGQLDGIASLSPGSVFVLREEDGWDSREVRITHGDDGSLSYDYEEDGDEASFDAEARRWFEQTLTEASHRLGIGAEERVAYLMDQGGVDAVLAETKTIDGDAAQRRYWHALIDRSELSMDDRNRVLRQAQRGLDSDYEMRRLLQEVTDTYAGAPEHFDVFADAVATLDSDYERRRVLAGVLDQPSLSEPQQERVLELISGLDSDYEKRRILQAYAEGAGTTVQGFDVLIRILEDIDSDYEKRRVLVGLLQQSEYSAEQQAALLKTASQIDSDHEKRRLVQALSEDVASSDVTFAELLRIARSIDSGFETRRLLTTLIEREEANPSHLVLLLEEARALESQHEKEELLQSVEHLSSHDDPEVRKAFNAALRSLL